RYRGAALRNGPDPGSRMITAAILADLSPGNVRQFGELDCRTSYDGDDGDVLWRGMLPREFVCMPYKSKGLMRPAKLKFEHYRREALVTDSDLYDDPNAVEKALADLSRPHKHLDLICTPVQIISRNPSIQDVRIALVWTYMIISAESDLIHTIFQH